MEQHLLRVLAFWHDCTHSSPVFDAVHIGGAYLCQDCKPCFGEWVSSCEFLLWIGYGFIFLSAPTVSFRVEPAWGGSFCAVSTFQDRCCCILSGQLHSKWGFVGKSNLFTETIFHLNEPFFHASTTIDPYIYVCINPWILIQFFYNPPEMGLFLAAWEPVCLHWLLSGSDQSMSDGAS